MVSEVHPTHEANMAVEVIESEAMKAFATLGAQNEVMAISLTQQSEIIAELCVRRRELAEGLEANLEALRTEQEARFEGDQKARALETSNSRLQHRLDEANSQLSVFQARCEEAECSQKRFQSKCGGLEVELQQSEATVKSLREQLLEKGAGVQAANVELGELRSKVASQEAKTKVLGEMWQTRAKLEDEVAKLTTRLEDAQAQVAQLQADVYDKDKKISDLERRVQDAVGGREREDGELQDLQWRAEAAEEAHTTLQRQIKAKLKETEAHIRSLEAELGKYKQHNEELEAEIQRGGYAQGELRSQCAALAQRTEKAEVRMNEELGARKKERKRADKADARIKELEAALSSLTGDLQKAKDGMGMMRTIAKIRDHDKDQIAVGFDAVGERTLDAVGKLNRRGAGRKR